MSISLVRVELVADAVELSPLRSVDEFDDDDEDDERRYVAPMTFFDDSLFRRISLSIFTGVVVVWLKTKSIRILFNILKYNKNKSKNLTLL